MAKHILNIDTDILGVLNLPNLNNDTGRLLTINNSNIVSERTISEIAVEGNFELKSNKGIANGYVPLDNSGLIPQAYLPPVTISETFVVASQAAMLALVAQTGDIAVRTDENKSYILQGTNPTILSEWQELLSPTDLVQSVNGLTGTVTLDLIFNSGLLSITGGNSVNLDNRYYTETEVNNLLTGYSQIGHVHTISDITDFPTDISHFNNDSGYLTSFTETDPIFTAHTASNIVNGTGLLKNDGVGNWSYDNSTYLTTISGLSHTLLSNVGVNTHAQIDSHIANSSTHFTMGSISITESQISDLQSYLTTEVNDLTQAVVWDNVPDANITQSSVVQHQAALTITESQISDLNHFTPNTLLADYSFTDNSANWDTAYSWGNHAGLYSLLGHTHTFNSLISKPTTLSGYGITDVYTKTESDGKYLLNTTDIFYGQLRITRDIDDDYSLSFGNSSRFGWGFKERVDNGDLEIYRIFSGVHTSSVRFDRNSNNTIFNDDLTAPNFIGNGSQLTDVDALKLGGQPASYYDFRNYGLGTTLVAISDFDAVTQTGFYYNPNPNTNGAPSTVASLNLIHVHIDSSRATQIVNRTGFSQQWYRRKSGGVWQPWVEIWHSGNLTPTDYLNKTTGGTITGTTLYDKTIAEQESANIKTVVNREFVEDYVANNAGGDGGGVLDTNTTELSSTGVASETLYTYTLLANTVSTGDILEITMAGRLNTRSNGSQVRISVANEALISSNPFTHSDVDFECVVRMVVVDVNTFKYVGTTIYKPLGGSFEGHKKVGVNQSSLDFTANQHIDFIIGSENAGEIVIKFTTVEIKKS